MERQRPAAGRLAAHTYRWPHLALVVLLALLAAGCRPAQVQPQPAASPTGLAAPVLGAAASVPAPTVTDSQPPASSTPLETTRTVEAPLPASPAPATCQESQGRTERHELPSAQLEAPLEVRVYTPPCYDQQTGQRYPVLYLFHGANSSTDQWDRVGVDEAADRLIASGELAPLLIVMPGETKFLWPSHTPFDEAILEELLPWVDSTYRTLPDREHRAVGGLSRGGAWALHFGLRYPQEFGRLGAHSAAAFLDDARIMHTWLEELPVELRPRIYLDIGDRDHLQESNAWVLDTLDAFNLPYTFYVFTGMHDEAYWSEHVERYLRWYAAGWQP